LAGEGTLGLSAYAKSYATSWAADPLPLPYHDRRSGCEPDLCLLRVVVLCKGFRTLAQVKALSISPDSRTGWTRMYSSALDERKFTQIAVSSWKSAFNNRRPARG
jgi:hypothetical protein